MESSRKQVEGVVAFIYGANHPVAAVFMARRDARAAGTRTPKTPDQTNAACLLGLPCLALPSCSSDPGRPDRPNRLRISDRVPPSRRHRSIASPCPISPQVGVNTTPALVRSAFMADQPHLTCRRPALLATAACVAAVVRDRYFWAARRPGACTCVRAVQARGPRH